MGDNDKPRQPRSRRERNLARDVNDPKRLRREAKKRQADRDSKKGNGKSKDSGSS